MHRPTVTKDGLRMHVQTPFNAFEYRKPFTFDVLRCKNEEPIVRVLPSRCTFKDADGIASIVRCPDCRTWPAALLRRQKQSVSRLRRHDRTINRTPRSTVVGPRHHQTHPPPPQKFNPVPFRYSGAPFREKKMPQKATLQPFHRPYSGADLHAR